MKYTGPDSLFGKIGKMIGGLDWKANVCKSFPVLSDEALCNVSNDQYCAYQICRSIIHGTLDLDMQ